MITREPWKEAEKEYEEWLEQEEEEEKRIARRPTCAICEKKIIDDEALRINDDFYCCRCVETNMVDLEEMFDWR